MNIFLITDLEAVAGVIDSTNWCIPGGAWYPLAKELLTYETNAAVDGFFAAGATRVVVMDGHGWGGIAPELLDPRAELIAGSLEHVPFPYGLEHNFDYLAWVGQHAMVGAAYAHLVHTGSFEVRRRTVNGIPMGEITQFAWAAAELGVRPIFLSGDKAACQEAEALIPGIRTVSVKEGLTAVAGDDWTVEQAREGFTSAMHLSPAVSRERIRAEAEAALRAAEDTPSIGVLQPPPAPYLIELVFRKTASGECKPPLYKEHPTGFIAANNTPYLSSID